MIVIHSVRSISDWLFEMWTMRRMEMRDFNCVCVSLCRARNCDTNGYIKQHWRREANRSDRTEVIYHKWSKQQPKQDDLRKSAVSLSKKQVVVDLHYFGQRRTSLRCFQSALSRASETRCVATRAKQPTTKRNQQLLA